MFHFMLMLPFIFKMLNFFDVQYPRLECRVMNLEVKLSGKIYLELVL